jgi:hypothetical protein
VWQTVGWRRHWSAPSPSWQSSAMSDAGAQRQAEAWMQHAWITGVIHATVSSVVLLAFGVNIVLAAHYPLASALAILLLAFGIRRGLRAAALLLFLAAITPATIKLLLGVLHPADLPAFPLAALYLRGFIGTVASTRHAQNMLGDVIGVEREVEIR